MSLVFTIFMLVLYLLSSEDFVFIFMMLFIISCIVSVFLLIFFRDPDRSIGPGIVAVADGVIREIKEGNDKDVGDCVCISTFMNIYHVHVNRMPLDATVSSIDHQPGGHLPAFRKESVRNEQVITLLETQIGRVKIIQIAGTLARRINMYITPMQKVKKGKRIGIIKLGSRVDLYVPKASIKHITVQNGDRVRAGEHQIIRIG